MRGGIKYYDTSSPMYDQKIFGYVRYIDGDLPKEFEMKNEGISGRIEIETYLHVFPYDIEPKIASYNYVRGFKILNIITSPYKQPRD
jgi:hypothetical protein